MGIWERLQDDTSAVNLKFLSLLAASLFRNFQIQNRTRIIKLLVVLRFRSSHPNVTRALANFGIGPLVTAAAENYPHRRRIVELAERSRPAAIYPYAEYTKLKVEKMGNATSKEIYLA